jgi:hypothetical protein
MYNRFAANAAKLWHSIPTRKTSDLLGRHYSRQLRQAKALEQSILFGTHSTEKREN